MDKQKTSPQLKELNNNRDSGILGIPNKSKSKWKSELLHKEYEPCFSEKTSGCKK